MLKPPSVVAVSALAVACGVFLSASPAPAQPVAVPTPDAARENLHRHLTEQGERVSRAFRQPLPAPPSNGIVQIPLDDSETVAPADGDAQRRSGPRIPIPSRVPPCPHPTLNPLTQLPMKTASLVKSFPDVTWHVCATDMGRKSLWVGPVHLKRGSGPWITVLKQAGLADIFVPYHTSFFRPYDLRWTSELDQVTQQDAPSGSLITLSAETMPTVIAEVRDRGVGWLCKDVTMATRRAQEFVVWGVADGGNYDNIVQYSFQDDGGIAFRLGNTGYNSPTDPPPTEAHTHNGLWRIDIDLDGPNNTAWLQRHIEVTPTPIHAQDLKIPFLNEGAHAWEAPEFSSVLIESATRNAFGNPLGYEFTPVQTGRARHYWYPEAWTRNDFYVTVYHSSELGWVQNWDEPDNYLIPSINGEWTVNTDLVVWVKSAAHHHPADEDRSAAGGWNGVTLTHWSGVDMQPHDLFNANPLGGPASCS
jgi:hypothetical protein